MHIAWSEKDALLGKRLSGPVGNFGISSTLSNPRPLAISQSFWTLEGQCYILTKPPARSGCYNNVPIDLKIEMADV